MVICLGRVADLHMAPLMPLPLTISCFSKIQIAFTFLVLAYPGSPGKRADKRVCVCVFARFSFSSDKPKIGREKHLQNYLLSSSSITASSAHCVTKVKSNFM